MGYVVAIPVFALALLLALPALCDAWAWLIGLARRRVPRGGGQQQRILFLVPAHNEELLIKRAVASLRGQTYPAELMTVLVVADNCDDRTAGAAREAGATVLERTSTGDRGKGHAIGWALGQVTLSDFAAVAIVDADTIVEPDYTSELMTWAPLEGRVLQTFDGLSNENESWLTRLAGLFTRNRYDIALPLKAAAGLSCPVTGDGLVIGTNILARDPWRVRTITEGWELYARYTLRGQHVDYAQTSRLYAQETRSLRQSGTQRARWNSGRLAVLSLHWREILTARISLLQKLDLFAELTFMGPIMRAVLGIVGAGLVLVLRPPGANVAAAAMLTAVLQPAAYSILSLMRHPEPGPTLRAFARLPMYAVWRVGLVARGFVRRRSTNWIRTTREIEAAPSQLR
jgi:cellulose synthase/poly-beta-1,6-N-acetylglucosamine synthase-like glycosyltransferase